MKATQLRNRIVAFFVGIALFISALFGAASFLFAYSIEDRFFIYLLDDEAQTVAAQLESGLEARPRLDFIRYYPEKHDLPAIIREVLDEEPNRIEFSGENDNHYHLKQIPAGYLLAEVSEQLVVRKIKGGMLKFILVLFGGVLVLALILAFTSLMMAKRLIKPLDTLVRIVEDAPVERLPQNFSGQFVNDEIGAFARTLEHALSRIRRFISREQAFTRDVSHELRTPVAITQSSLTLLRQTPLTDKQAELVGRIADAQHQITQSLEVLLALAREETLADANTRVLPLVEQVILSQAEKIAGKEIEVEVDIAAKLELPIAPSALRLLLNNLIGNAFTHIRSGVVTIEGHAQSIMVSDTGEGIAPDLLKTLFEPGVKGPESEGMGMGLSMVKRLCEKLDIELSVSSSDSGSAFCLKFPDGDNQINQ
ncbi:MULTISPECIES: HAMP domain-containing sensor histidine kinase [unclassified Pseudoalteromonas]|uniref:sensor histidine kinase n=1 Tax=unclassified Pseudoalteromonas TaxID=194690 RepID=UPI0020976A63|nr:HAMP domain-containing sensor histidine kinase [Pseudoalteromonas sp. XMcav2-N]MCO7191042.1 HAMP domain-containing histidine kinase [Pseudoalteromonas sp. XMcav2-N]